MDFEVPSEDLSHGGCGGFVPGDGITVKTGGEEKAVANNPEALARIGKFLERAAQVCMSRHAGMESGTGMHVQTQVCSQTQVQMFRRVCMFRHRCAYSDTGIHVQTDGMHIQTQVCMFRHRYTCSDTDKQSDTGIHVPTQVCILRHRYACSDMGMHVQTQVYSQTQVCLFRDRLQNITFWEGELLWDVRN